MLTVNSSGICLADQQSEDSCKFHKGLLVSDLCALLEMLLQLTLHWVYHKSKAFPKWHHSWPILELLDFKE